MTYVPRAIAGAIAVLLLFSLPAGAQIAGSLHTARPLDPKTSDVGGYFGLTDGEGRAGTTVAAFGQVRHGLFSAGDGGLKFGLVDIDDGGNVGLLLAGDMQWALLAPRWGDNFWLSFGPEISLYDAAGKRVWGFAGNISASRDFGVHGRRISPYARLTLRLEAIDHDNPMRKSRSELRVGLNPGVIWEAGGYVDFVAELQFDHQFGFLAGLNFRI